MCCYVFYFLNFLELDVAPSRSSHSLNASNSVGGSAKHSGAKFSRCSPRSSFVGTAQYISPEVVNMLLFFD